MAEAARSLADWLDVNATRRADLVDLVGSALTYRCTRCHKLATDHVGGDVIGCTDTALNDTDFKESLERQCRSQDLLLACLTQYRHSITDVQVLRDENAALNDKLKSVQAEKDDLDTTNDSLVDENKALQVKQDGVVNSVCFYWQNYVSGRYDPTRLCQALEDEFNFKISPSIFPPGNIQTPASTTSTAATAPTSTGTGTPAPAQPTVLFPGTPLQPSSSVAQSLPAAVQPIFQGGSVVVPPPGGAAASVSPAGGVLAPSVAATGGVGTPASSTASGVAGVSSSAAATAPAAPVAGAADVADGKLIGKSTKAINVVFQQDDTAIGHLQKELSILNEITLLFPSANTATRISIVVSHCAKEVKPIAMTVRDGHRKGTFATVDDFLSAFRLERFPSFANECRIAYGKMQQRFKESSMQFYFRFVYLLNAMKRDPEEYLDDYIKKLCFPKVVEQVRFRKHGKTLAAVAQLCNDVENELGVRDKAKNWGDDDDDSCDVLQLTSGSNRGGRGGNASRGRGGRGGRGGQRGGRGGRGGQRGGQRGSSSTQDRSLQDHFNRLDVWGVAQDMCWNCFEKNDDMNEHKKTCSKTPCVFCQTKGHRSVYCSKAPVSKEDFETALKKLK